MLPSPLVESETGREATDKNDKFSQHINSSSLDKHQIWPSPSPQPEPHSVSLHSLHRDLEFLRRQIEMVWPWESRLNQCVSREPRGDFTCLMETFPRDGWVMDCRYMPPIRINKTLRHWGMWLMASPPVYTCKQIKCVQAHTDVHTHNAWKNPDQFFFKS